MKCTAIPYPESKGDRYSEQRIFINRIIASTVFVILLSAALIARLLFLQVEGHELYVAKSHDNRIKILPLPPRRGLIFDRNGATLAENIPTFSLELIPEQIEDLDKTIAELKTLLGITTEEIEKFHQSRKGRKSFTSTPLRTQLTEQEVARFSVNLPYFPGVEIHARLLRYYPFGELTAHLVGYVGRINEKELKRLDPGNYKGTHYIGKTGIEKSYEAMLHGSAGYEEVETNARGRFIKNIATTPATAGANLHLTLDIDIQKIAYEALGDYSGALAAIEIATGGVIALVSKPGFDPNPFVHGISFKAYRELQKSPDQPLYDRGLRGQYPPGSTFKPFVALAGLEYQAINTKKKIYCPGHFSLPNSSHRYRDWKKWGHGSIDLENSIQQSCDVYYYNLAHNLGIDRLHTFLTRFGFGQKSGIDVAGEKAGLLPSRAWKRRVKGITWYPGETVITGIGQGFVLTTPLQLARATATLANNGKVVYPHLVEHSWTAKGKKPWLPPESENLALQPAHVKAIIDAMISVVHGPRGTARRLAKGIDYKIAGKTGTAQVFTVKQNASYNAKRLAKKLHDHALFIAFAPADNPRIAVAVIVENGGHGGSVAAPIAAKVIAEYLETSG